MTCFVNARACLLASASANVSMEHDDKKCFHCKVALQTPWNMLAAVIQLQVDVASHVCKSESL
eukprot:1169037-Alexandrium_andersonii.AAC.1